MDRDILLERFEEKEVRLKQLDQISIEIMLLKKQVNKLDRQTQKLINMDPDYKRYKEQCNKDEEYSGNLDYDEYCEFLKLLIESPAESELYSKLLKLLKIQSSIPNPVEHKFDKRLWLQIMDVLSTKMPEKEFTTWMKEVYPVSCGENIIKLSVDNEMNKYILESEYELMIIDAIKDITGNAYRIEYIIHDNR
ncbi:MAG TPA: DnaA N-terminal domain-containing protein [Bacillota bacterium]|jgi:hypothetical protein|nr:DnaA N-terminal domain-containing protein [Bacillota bacterium]